MTVQTTPRIAFQGALGAYSHEACLQACPDMEPVPCQSFEGVIRAVNEGRAELAMLPVENTTYGRVADIHRLLPESGLHIIGRGKVRNRLVHFLDQAVQHGDHKPQHRADLHRHQ